jgi:hypothetical protein
MPRDMQSSSNQNVLLMLLCWWPLSFLIGTAVLGTRHSTCEEQQRANVRHMAVNESRFSSGNTSSSYNIL